MAEAKRRSSGRKKTQKVAGDGAEVGRYDGILDEALAVTFCALALFLLMSFLSFELNGGQLSGLKSGVAGTRNLLGPVGHVTGTVLSGFMGWCAVVPVGWAVYLALYWWHFDDRQASGQISSPSRAGVAIGLLGLGGILISSCVVAASFFGAEGGGSIGVLLAKPLLRFFNGFGTVLISGAAFLFALAVVLKRSVGEIVVLSGLAVHKIVTFAFVVFPAIVFRALLFVAGSVAAGMRRLSVRTGLMHARVGEPEIPSPKLRKNAVRSLDGRSGEEEIERRTAQKSTGSEKNEETARFVEPEIKRTEIERKLSTTKAGTQKLTDAVEKSIDDGAAALELDDQFSETERDYGDVVVARREHSDVRPVLRTAPRKVVVDAKSNEPDLPYIPPDISLLTRGEASVGGEDDEELRHKSKLIEDKLRDFSILGKVTHVHPGPVITLFEFEPAPGVKVGKIAALQDDLAMSLRASSIRIIAPIPKRGSVGIEVPNRHRDIVRLRDCLESEAFINAESTLSVPIGKDTYGEPVVVDIATMPHLLMAGATGAGKSVCINTLLLSLLFRARPDELGLILIDPKILELSVYEDIPHLRVPVVTVPRQAKAVLDWAVNEMNRRYRLMQKYGVRNIDGYNRIVRGEEESTTKPGTSKVNSAASAANVIELTEDEMIEPGIVDPVGDTAVGTTAGGELDGEKPQFAEELKPLPKIVIVIDELADLMLTVGKDIEELITRLAQKARASGIHLILATQRPSVDVITGLIKANFPARLSFRVTSRIDSRTILDSMGAEKLLGKGDMLFMAPGAEALKRVHGAFVSDAEVTRVIDALKANNKPRYDDRIIAVCEKALEEEAAEADSTKDLMLEDGEYDAIYDRAVELVMEKGQASTSMIQRAFRIGYNRAARIIDMMEREGVIGPMDGAKPRDVLVPKDPAEPQ